MRITVLDNGNSQVKGANFTREIVFPHGLKELTATDWDHIMSRGGEQDESFIKVDGTPYVVGAMADEYGFAGHRTGSARYNETYYGVFAAIALFRLYEQSQNNIVLFASHAPQDIEYRPDLIASVLIDHPWTVECCGETRTFTIREVFCFDEPVGGMMNQLINAEATGYQNPEIREGELLAIDIGGFTTDLAVLREGKVIHYASRSEEVGILEVEREVRAGLLALHKTKFKNSRKPTGERIRHAIRYGEYDGGGYGWMDCSDIVNRATNRIVRRILDLYAEAGGTATFRNILLTGGGSALLEDRLRNALNHPRIVLADTSEDLHLANVRGGLKMIKFWQKEGLL